MRIRLFLAAIAVAATSAAADAEIVDVFTVDPGVAAYPGTVRFDSFSSTFSAYNSFIRQPSGVVSDPPGVLYTDVGLPDLGTITDAPDLIDDAAEAILGNPNTGYSVTFSTPIDADFLFFQLGQGSTIAGLEIVDDLLLQISDPSGALILPPLRSDFVNDNYQGSLAVSVDVSDTPSTGSGTAGGSDMAGDDDCVTEGVFVYCGGGATGPGGGSASGDLPDAPPQVGAPCNPSAPCSAGTFGIILPGMQIDSLTLALSVEAQSFLDARPDLAGLYLADISPRVYAGTLQSDVRAFFDDAIFAAPETPPSAVPLPPSFPLLVMGIMMLALRRPR